MKPQIKILFWGLYSVPWWGKKANLSFETFTARRAVDQTNAIICIWARWFRRPIHLKIASAWAFPSVNSTTKHTRLQREFFKIYQTDVARIFCNSLHNMRHACCYTLNPFISMKMEVLPCWTYTNLASLTLHFSPGGAGQQTKAAVNNNVRGAWPRHYATAPCWVFTGDSEHCELQISRADHAGDASGIISALVDFYYPPTLGRLRRAASFRASSLKG